MYWKDVVGHKQIAEQLRQQVQADKLPHALLLHADDGVGALAFARALYTYLCCTNRSDTDCCGACSNCHKNAGLIHADVHFTFPVQRKEKKTMSKDYYPEWRKFLEQEPFGDLQDWLKYAQLENKQLNISKDDCQQVIKNLSLKAYEGGKKVALIWMAEFLGKEGNRLLKMIEEPQQDTHFILIADQLDQILPTILSRCQIVHLHRLSASEISAYAMDLGASESAATGVAYIADGNLALAKRLIGDQDQAVAKDWIAWMRTLYKGIPIEMVKWVDQYAKTAKEAQKAFLQYGLHFLRELQLGIWILDYKPRLENQYHRSFDGLKKVLDEDQILQIITIINQQLYHLERNAHVKISMMHTSVAIKRVMKAAVVQIKS